MYHGRAVVLLYLLLCLACLAFVAGGKNDLKYAIMLDGGSTKTALHVYTYNGTVYEDFLLIENGSLILRAPALSSFTTNTSAAGPSLKPLISTAKLAVPESQWATTPIYLMATAGMRLLSSDIQDEILKSIREFLGSDSDCPFAFVDEWATVIPGLEEGAFGWITLNRLLGTLNAPDPRNTYGALDLGGASAEITFYSGISKLPGDYAFDNILNRPTFSLYGHSYLYYGNDQARYAKNDLIIAQSQRKKNTEADAAFEDPCLPTGYVYLYNSTYNFTGASDFGLCSQLALQILNKNASCARSPCAFNGVYQPPVQGKFYAFSGFATLVSVVYNTTDPLTLSLANLTETVQRFCSLDYLSLIALYPDQPSIYLTQDCFMGAYIVQLLESGYGFDFNSTQITFASQLPLAGTEMDLDWTLGAVMYQLKLLYKARGFPYKWIYVAAATCFAGTLLVVLACVLLRSNRNREYEPINREN